MKVTRFLMLTIAVLVVTAVCSMAAPLTITTTSLPPATVGTPYSATLAASGGTAPYTWYVTYCSGACTTGLSFNLNSGALFGTPLHAGNSTLTFKVKDARSQTVSKALTVAISAIQTLAISTASMPNGTVGTSYSKFLSATGGSSPYTWAITGCSGDCNTGLGFTNSGEMYGTPQNAGTSTFGFLVTDATAATAAASLALTINAQATNPSITTGSLPSGTVGTAYSMQLAATGGTAPYTWAVTACSGDCNTGLNNPNFASTGMLSGTPTGSGTSTFTFRVTDAAARTATAALPITINPASQTVSITISPTSVTLQPNATQQFTAIVSGASDTSVTWQLSGDGALGSTGLYTAPATSGSATVTAIANADNTKTVSAPVTISSAPAGANWYVATTGSNSNDCSSAHPCATPDYVFNNKAVPGDVIQVAAGTYDYGSGALITTASGSSGGGYITLQCATRWACKIQNSVTGNGTVVWTQGDYTIFDGFEVTNTSSAGNNLGVYVSGSYTKILHNKIHNIQTDCGDNGGGGIQVAGSGSQAGDGHDLVMDGNLIYDVNYTPSGGFKCPANVVQSDGILSETAGANVRITNNIIHHTGGGWGIVVGSSDAFVANNLVFNTSNGGILTVQTSGTFANNLVFNTGLVSSQCGIMTPSGSSANITHNIVYGNTNGNYCVHWGTSISDPGTGNQVINPASGTLFVNWNTSGAGDYHLKAGSPAISAGASVGVTTDFDGATRSTTDVGPYKY